MSKSIFLLLLFMCCTMSVSAQIANTVTSKDCYFLYEYNGTDFSKNKKLKANTPIEVIEEFDKMHGFYKVKYKKLLGYLNASNIYMNEEMDAYVHEKENKEKMKIAEEAKKDSILKKGREEYEREKFGKWYVYVKRHEIKIGMPENCIIPCVGQPNKINTSEYSFGTYKQYVYDNMYIYVENGKVTSIQR